MKKEIILSRRKDIQLLQDLLIENAEDSIIRKNKEKEFEIEPKVRENKSVKQDYSLNASKVNPPKGK